MVYHGLPLCNGSYKSAGVLSKSYNREGYSAPLFIRNYYRLSTINHCHARVGRAKVYSNYSHFIPRLNYYSYSSSIKSRTSSEPELPLSSVPDSTECSPFSFDTTTSEGLRSLSLSM